MLGYTPGFLGLGVTGTMSNEYKNARTIKIFLRDGNPDGTRWAELTMSTTWAMAFRRSQLSDARATFGENIQRSGVYILLDADDSPSDRRQAYIGESEKVYQRLTTHNSDDEKQFWEDTVVLASKDENLTKAHVRHVEARLVEEAGRNPGWLLPAHRPAENAGDLPLPDRCDMDKFVDQAKMLVGVLGCDLFRSPRFQDAESGDEDESAATGSEIQETFYFKGDGFRAKMRLGESGIFVVERGSLAKVDEVPTVPDSAKKIRERMLTESDLRPEGESLVFSADYGFKSVSSAAAVVSGSSRNGRAAWKLDDGRTYGEWEAAKSDTADGNEDR